MAPKPRRRIKTKKLKNQLQNEISADVADFGEKCSSDDDIINDIIFSNGLRDAEHEIMKLYQETFNIHPLDRSHKLFTRDEMIERSAQNMAFWQKLLREYDENDFDSCTSNPRYYYIKMKEAEVRVNIFKQFDNDKPLLKIIITRLLELVNETVEQATPCSGDDVYAHECTRTWYDNQFTHADKEAFALPGGVKVYYNDDGIYACPVTNRLYTLKNNDLTLREVVGKLYFGKQTGDDRRPTLYVTDVNDIKQLFPQSHADLMASIIMNKIIKEHKFEHFIMDSGSHIYIVQEAVVDCFSDSKPLLLKDVRKYI